MTDVSELVPFTGYYSMNANNAASGAFLSIDTTEENSMAAGIPKITTIAINVSMDGKSVETYPFAGPATFDGRTLSIPGKLTLDFTREYKDGHLAIFSGTIGGTDVNGETYFNPVALSAFIGDYYYYDKSRNKKHPLSVRSGNEIWFDFSVFSKNASGDLQLVNSYSYVPAMFVLRFSGRSGSDPQSFMLMLGTAGSFGLACSIQDADSPPKFAPIMALSILP